MYTWKEGSQASSLSILLPGSRISLRGHQTQGILLHPENRTFRSFNINLGVVSDQVYVIEFILTLPETTKECRMRSTGLRQPVEISNY